MWNAQMDFILNEEKHVDSPIPLFTCLCILSVVYAWMIVSIHDLSIGGWSENTNVDTTICTFACSPMLKFSLCHTNSYFMFQIPLLLSC